ncbi:hypothetical protein AYO39_03605, partial [Actinobacteria bacterium SCGC AG-212-D09]
MSYDRRVASEWYTNGPLGLEQGFTIPSRLGGAVGPLRLSVAVGGGLRPAWGRDGRQVSFERAGGTERFGYGGLVATDARGDRLPAWFSVGPAAVQIIVRDRGARYPLRIDPFVQQGKLVGGGAVGTAEHGYSVALSGDGSTALIGAPTDNSSTGAAWVFTRSGSTWSQQGHKLVGNDVVGTARLGASVALSSDGNTALIAGPNDNGTAGAVWVFTRSGSTWTQQGSKLVGTGAVGHAYQGISASLSGDGNTALVGGYYDDGQTGAAWVFTRSGSTWTQQGSKLVGTGAAGRSSQGWSVSLSGDGNTALIGAPAVDINTGAAWLFTRSGTTWTQQGSKLVGTGGVGQPNEGYSVALSHDGNTALIGGPFDYNATGAAWVFTRAGSTWSQQGAKLVVSGDALGWGGALSGDGNTAVLGAPLGYIGTAWVFLRSGSTWSRQEYLQGTGGRDGSDQGWGVALSADGLTALIGSPVDNGQAGAAWVFSRPPSPWITSFSRGSGITGSHLTIAGINFTGATSVKFGSVASTFTVLSDTQIDATVPNGASAGPISVTTPAGTGVSSTSFKPTLSITSVSPTCGPFGTVVTLRGIGFTPGATVKFNGSAATVNYVNSGEVQATVPSSATKGPPTLTNTTAPVGKVQSPTSYTVTPHTAPTIGSFSPGSGITGSSVTITGTNLCGANRVTFGGVATSAFTVLSQTQLRASVANGAVVGPIS